MLNRCSPCRARFLPGGAVTYNTEAAPAQIANRVAAFKRFSCGDPGGNTFKVYGGLCVPVGYSQKYITNGFSAPWAVGNWQRFSIYLGGNPFGPFEIGCFFPMGVFPASFWKIIPMLRRVSLMLRFQVLRTIRPVSAVFLP